MLNNITKFTQCRQENVNVRCNHTASESEASAAALSPRNQSGAPESEQFFRDLYGTLCLKQPVQAYARPYAERQAGRQRQRHGDQAPEKLACSKTRPSLSSVLVVYELEPHN